MPSRLATSATECPRSVTCLTASTLNSCVYRLLLIDAPFTTANYGCKVSRKAGAIHTSHLDVLRERLVNDAVKQLKLTKLIVAHRPETIPSADRVLVMEQGRIVQKLRPQTSPAEVTTASA